MKTYFVAVSDKFFEDAWDRHPSKTTVEIVQDQLNVHSVAFIVNGIRQLCEDKDIYQIKVKSEAELLLICLKNGISIVPNDTVMQYVNKFNKHHLLLENA